MCNIHVQDFVITNYVFPVTSIKPAGSGVINHIFMGEVIRREKGLLARGLTLIFCRGTDRVTSYATVYHALIEKSLF